MKNKLLKALAIGLSITTLTMMGSAAVFAEAEASEATEEAAEDVEADAEGEDAEAATEDADAEGEDAETVTEDAEAEEEDEENYETGDASLDNIRNQDDIGENEILVLSFGTSFNDNRRLTIGAIEQALDDAFSGDGWSVRRGFTANIIIDHVESRDGIHIDDVEEAMQRAVDNGVKNLVIQPTHLMHGNEYKELSAEVAEYADAFEKLVIAEPLLSSDEDFEKVEKIITDATAEYDDGETAIVFMGHGTPEEEDGSVAESNEVYTRLQGMLTEDGFENYYIGTVEAGPSAEEMIESFGDKAYTKVVLRPLMVVAGDHANNDMADPDDPESWYSTFAAAGYEVTAVVEGLGQLEEIPPIYVEHCQAAIDQLAE